MTAPGNQRAQPMSRDTALMALGTILSRVTGFARLFALAYALGALRLADAYNLANTTPNIVYDLIVGGVVSATLIPVFVDRLTNETRERAWEGISAVITLATAVAVAVSVVFALAAPVIVRLYLVGNHHFTAEQTALAAQFLRFFAPQVAFYGLIALATALLNTRRRFAAPMFVPIVNNLVVIGILLGVGIAAHDATHHLTLHQVYLDHTLLVVLGLGTTAGVALQALALVPSLLLAGLRLRWRWDPRSPALAAVIRLSGWTFGFVVANQIALLVMLALAGHQVGGVSAWTYAFTFFQLPYGIVAVSIMSAIQPDLAQRWSEEDVTGFRQQVAGGLRATLAIIVPAAFGYIVLARPIVTLVLGHGAASATDVHLTAQVMTMFAIGLPGFCAFLLLMRAYQAMRDTRSAFLLYVLENGLNVILGFVLYRPLGTRGLALSFSIAYSVAALAALVDLGRRGLSIRGFTVGRSLVRSAAISALMAAVVAVVAALIGSDTGLGLLLRVGTAVAAGVTVFFGAAGIAAEARPRGTDTSG